MKMRHFLNLSTFSKVHIDIYVRFMDINIYVRFSVSIFFTHCPVEDSVRVESSASWLFY